MRHFLQIVIAGAVLFSNVRWQWTPNGYLAAILAGLAAWLVTVFPLRLLAWSVKLRARFRQQKLDNRVPRWRGIAERRR